MNHSKRSESRDDLAPAWSRATDIDVARALLDLDDFSPEAKAAIHTEAARRGIDATTRDIPPQPPVILWRGLASAFRNLAANRFLVCFLIGIAFTVLTRLLAASGIITTQAGRLSFYFALLLCTVLAANWPLRSYKKGAINTLAFALPNILWPFIFVLSSSLTPVWYIFAFPFGNALVHWLFPFLGVVLVIWLRRKMKPIYAAGHCLRCGYDLTGLPLPRCPECGQGF